MDFKIKNWVATSMLILSLGFGWSALAQPQFSQAAEVESNEVPSNPGTLSETEKKEEDSVKPENEIKKETVKSQWEERSWSAEEKGLRIKQDTTIVPKDFLQLDSLKSLAVEKIDWGQAAPLTSTSGDFKTTLLITLKDGSQILYLEVPYEVYTCKDETLISGLSYDKQAGKLTGKTEPAVQVAAEAQFSSDPNDIEIMVTESDEKGVFAVTYSKEPYIISLTVTKEPYVQYATTKYEVETNQVEMNYDSQTSSEPEAGTVASSSVQPIAAVKTATRLPQTDEVTDSGQVLLGFLCLCMFYMGVYQIYRRKNII